MWKLPSTCNLIQAQVQCKKPVCTAPDEISMTLYTYSGILMLIYIWTWDCPGSPSSTEISWIFSSPIFYLMVLLILDLFHRDLLNFVRTGISYASNSLEIEAEESVSLGLQMMHQVEKGTVLHLWSTYEDHLLLLYMTSHQFIAHDILQPSIYPQFQGIWCHPLCCVGPDIHVIPI